MKRSPIFDELILDELDLETMSISLDPEMEYTPPRYPSDPFGPRISLRAHEQRAAKSSAVASPTPASPPPRRSRLTPYPTIPPQWYRDQLTLARVNEIIHGPQAKAERHAWLSRRSHDLSVTRHCANLVSMIEQGIVKLIQTTPAILAVCPHGGYMAELLPKDAEAYMPTWTWRVISNMPDTGLTFSRGLTFCRFQIDVYGHPNRGGADCVQLSALIDNLLSGYSGYLPDGDSLASPPVIGTFVSSIFGSDQSDDFNESLRSYRRMLEYEINYASS